MKLRRRTLISQDLSKDRSTEGVCFQRRSWWVAGLCTLGNRPRTRRAAALCCAPSGSAVWVCVGDGTGAASAPLRQCSLWERYSAPGGFLQSAVTTRSELTFTEHQLPLDNCLHCLCDQNSSAGNGGCEWQIRLRGCVRSLPPTALPVKSKCNLL